MSVDILPYASDILDLDLGMDACCTLRVINTGKPVCSQPAEWAVQLDCCGSIKVVCDNHQDVTWACLPRTFTCVKCKTAMPATRKSWRI